MQTRSRGKSNLLSSDELQRAERAKRERQRQNRVEAESSSGFQTGSELQLSDDDSGPETMADNHGGAPPPGVFHHKPGIQLQAQRPARQIGAGDIPTIPANRPGITPPPVPNFNFDIKTSLINLVENSIFHGMKDEDPLKHLEKFDRICALQKINNVTEDALKLRLFPSL
ncbi:unnamed protein product [Microthlaspi erraticum]|uniref:Uncharacterized protein n=1 Tax=Microthlaspi erraticum TaxID=1685480 RepID=A0A6D2IFL4_9BRAS|nr:unnamed protein product [Microthlaspi erraticum]